MENFKQVLKHTIVKYANFSINKRAAMSNSQWNWESERMQKTNKSLKQVFFIIFPNLCKSLQQLPQVLHVAVHTVCAIIFSYLIFCYCYPNYQIIL